MTPKHRTLLRSRLQYPPMLQHLTHPWNDDGLSDSPRDEMLRVLGEFDELEAELQRKTTAIALLEIEIAALRSLLRERDSAA